jgi:hypothetical protein
MAESGGGAGLVDAVNHLLLERGWSDWQVLDTSDLDGPASGIRVRFAHPLSRGVDLVLAPQPIEDAVRYVGRFLDSTPEFTRVASSIDAVRSESLPILRCLRYAAEHQDSWRAVESIAWTLSENGILSASELEWVISELRIGASQP